LFHGVYAVHGLAADLPFRRWLQQGPKTAPEYLVIIYD
jgi:hypothetical protein